MPMNTMGTTNQYWGVCGFTSSFYAMYTLNQAKRPQLNNAGTATRVLAEIKTYLNMLKADGKTQMLDSIVAFTRTFGGNFANFTIDGYIARVNQAVSRTEQEIIGDELYGIALPPDVVADYLKRMWDYNTRVHTVIGGGGGNGDGIIGVTSGTMAMYDGLEHYMYRRNGVVYSWGDQFDSVAAAAAAGAGGADWRVCRLIEILT